MKKKVITAMCALMLAFSVAPAIMPMTTATTVFAASEKTASEVTIRYEDGVDNAVFDAVEIVVKKGSNVPDIGLTPVRQGYVFNGWTPSANVTADSDMTFTAKWVGDDSLTNEDRANIKADADKTRSQYSVDSVNGSVTAGYANTAGENSFSDNNQVAESNTATSETTTTEATDGKQDAYTDDVDTGDMDMLTYCGAMIVAVAAVGGMIAIIRVRKTHEE